MEMETMFTEQKWNILKCLSEDKYSPLQLADKLETTMANISQQLRLLEATNLVKKEKIRNRDKGKPRTLFSLSEDHAYLISAMDRFADKRLLKVNDHHKTVLRIWFLEDEILQNNVEKVYWKIKPKLSGIDMIAVDEENKEIIIVSDKKDIVDIKENDNIKIKILPTRQKGRIKDKVSMIYNKEKKLLNAQ